MSVSRKALNIMKEDNQKVRKPLISKEKKNEILEMLIGGTSLKKISVTPKMPKMMAIIKELVRDQDFKKEYEFAKQWGAEIKVTEMEEIVMNDEISYGNKKLLIDVLKWKASKLIKQYGDKKEDGDKGNKIQLIIETSGDTKTININNQEEGE